MHHKRDGADIIIGATVRRHDRTLLSGNTRHFERLGLGVLDPFAALSEEKREIIRSFLASAARQ